MSFPEATGSSGPMERGDRSPLFLRVAEWLLGRRRRKAYPSEVALNAKTAVMTTDFSDDSVEE